MPEHRSETPAKIEHSPSFFGERAMQHVRVLAKEIGPRPAGSQAERRAMDYISGLLTSWGYQVERQPAAYAPLPRLFLPYPVGILLLGLLAWFTQTLLVFAIGLPILLYILPTYVRWAIRRRPLTQTTTNLYAFHPASDQQSPSLILSAHVDSARASPLKHPFWLHLRYQSLPMIQRVALAIAIISVFDLIGVEIPAWFDAMLTIAISLSGAWLIFTQIYDQVFYKNRYSSGAVDNASGVAVLLVAAEVLASQPSHTPHIPALLFTSAEETGMHGGRAFAASFPAAQPKPAVLCLDMVGAGNTLYYITGDGTLFPSRTTPQLNNIIQKLEPDAKSLWYYLRSGDFAPLLQAGFPAAALQSGGSIPAELAYHTLRDTLDVIQVDTLVRTSRLVLNFIREYMLHKDTKPAS